jgi:hypothetical protein
MVGTLVGKERRPIWVALAIGFGVVVATSMWLGGRARSDALERGTTDASHAVQTELVPVLSANDLTTDLSPARVHQLRAGIDAGLISTGAFDEVRIYRPDGSSLVASDPGSTGPADAATIVTDVAAGAARSRTTGDRFEAFVPISSAPGETAAVVELSRPATDIAAAGRSWSLVAIVAGALALFALAMVAVTGRAAPAARTSSKAPTYRPAIPRRAATQASSPEAATVWNAAVDAFGVMERKAREKELADAEDRAQQAEEGFRTVQEQLRHTLAQISDLEGRLGMEEQARVGASAEVTGLREELRDTANRLHKAELDNDALRERLALRQLDLQEERRRATEATPSAEEVEDLRLRLETAEQAAAALARELERTELELEHANSRFHMTKLTEALRSFEGDDDEFSIASAEGSDDPMIIQNGSSLSSGKTR